MTTRFAPLQPDDPATVAGYTLRARLGSGGMGKVYLSFTPGGRPIAIKVIRPEFAEDEQFRRRFRQEIEAAQRVQGVYTAPVIDASADAAVPWLATAYVPGPSLHEAVDRHGTLPPATVLRLLAGTAEALGAIHAAGLVHRDLKPANVLLAEDGPRVIDFGIARAADATTLTRTGARIGTPAFMSPDQILGLPATPATDVFALGHLAVWSLTGRPAFGDGPTDALLFRIVHRPPDLDGCPEPLRELAGRCLAKTAAERPTPAEIMRICRTETAGSTMSLAEPWLPAGLAAALAGYETSAAPPPRPGTLQLDPPPPGTDPAPQVHLVTVPRQDNRLLYTTLGALATLVAGATVLYLAARDTGPQRPAGAPATVTESTTVTTTPTTTPSPSTTSSPIAQPQSQPRTRYWVDTFANTLGYSGPAKEGAPLGELWKNTNYVFCKRWGANVTGNSGQYNHWWLLTNLDRLYPGAANPAYVPALYLTRWGNDEARDNSGAQIPTCPPS